MHKPCSFNMWELGGVDNKQKLGNKNKIVWTVFWYTHFNYMYKYIALR